MTAPAPGSPAKPVNLLREGKAGDSRARHSNSVGLVVFPERKGHGAS